MSTTTTTTVHGLSVQDWAQIQGWNSYCPQGTNACLHDIIQARARLQPDAIAVCAWDGQMTYEEFDKATSQLSCWLVEQGMKNEELVPVCFEKSKWAVVTMVAILKSGGAFVPLDYTQPLERLNIMMEELGSSMVTTSSLTADLLEGLADAKTLIINQELLDTLPQTEFEVPRSVSPNQTAFVMFTVSLSILRWGTCSDVSKVWEYRET
jgi:non-ribosomal peptide synthetase component F